MHNYFDLNVSTCICSSLQSLVHHICIHCSSVSLYHNVLSGARACDTAMGLPDLILKNLGMKGIEGERLFTSSPTRLNRITFCLPVQLEQGP